MLKGKHIAVLSANCLQGLGVKSILNEYFNPETIAIYNDPGEFIQKSTAQFDFIILNTELFIAYNEFFQSIKNKLILLQERDISPGQTSYATINTTLTQPEIVEQLEKIFLSRIKIRVTDNQEELSVREIEVLKLVAVGLTNKQIADQLFISMHTVITHRKNINRKLGIKTVSGLTVYALINGMISSSE